MHISHHGITQLMSREFLSKARRHSTVNDYVLASIIYFGINFTILDLMKHSIGIIHGSYETQYVTPTTFFHQARCLKVNMNGGEYE